MGSSLVEHFRSLINSINTLSYSSTKCSQCIKKTTQVNFDWFGNQTSDSVWSYLTQQLSCCRVHNPCKICRSLIQMRPGVINKLLGQWCPGCFYPESHLFMDRWEILSGKVKAATRPHRCELLIPAAQSGFLLLPQYELKAGQDLAVYRWHFFLKTTVSPFFGRHDTSTQTISRHQLHIYYTDTGRFFQSHDENHLKNSWKG